MTLTGKQIRQSFLDYFASKEHTVVKSASLVPSNDPTLYFTNAGMVPFKNTFTGQELRPYHRATSSQKCMRVSGKHNDLENVGRTARHHTFFEMLGNFSFGDYFKTGAIGFAWEFLTEVVKLPKNKLWVTVYQDDDEAFDLWHKKIGLAKDRIVRLGDKDNFWSMGETGPCGPCSEIIFEQDIPCSLNNPDCRLGNCDCDKFLEVWNLVFMQFERHADGSKTPLPKPSIDTGMGLERLTALLQNKNSNYDCDLFSPIIKTIEALVQKKYTHDLTNENDVSIRVLADHIRSSVFLIGDGVLPSNEGRGYVLRRILRRAIRHGKLLGQTQPFFYKLVSVVLEEMGTAYPELSTHRDTIEKVIHAEEERFLETLDKGLKLLSEEISTHQKNKQKLLSGTVAFKLYDTFGFPLDLTEIIALGHGLTIDQDGFNTAMNEQKERARA
ncbi:MAG TPA: alanine--tRNA ligase, partial [bacterium]|nr:alanine--tRNA ligase [bacterium]